MVVNVTGSVKDDFCRGSVALQYLHRQRLRCTKREIDRLAEQFQELFRQIDQDKQQGL